MLFVDLSDDWEIFQKNSYRREVDTKAMIYLLQRLNLQKSINI